MTLDPNKLIITDGAPAGGVQKTKSTANLKYVESGENTTLSIQSGGTSGTAALSLVDSLDAEKYAVVLDEATGNILIESVSGEIIFQLPAAKFVSFLGVGPDTDKLMRLRTVGTNGGVVDFYITDRDPSGNITGNPGDLVFRSNGVSSRQYIHEGSAPSNSDWAEISTMPPGETNLHSGNAPTPGGENTEIQYNNNGVFAGISGIKTDGTNLIVSGKVEGDSTGGLLRLTGKPGAVGGLAILEGGFGDTGGGPVIIQAGLTDNGPGANVTTVGGPGGTEGGSAPGGDVIDISGSGNSNNQRSGDLHYKSGNPDGSGTFGNMFLMEDGGNVGIGSTTAPATLLDIQASGPAITLRNTADFGRADIDLYGSRNAGAGNAELGTLSMFNTRSGSDEMVARIGFVNGQSGTSAGGIHFLTKENADGSLSIRLSIDDAGRVLINGEDASRVAPDSKEIFTSSEFDALATAGVITVDGVSLSIIFKDSITATNLFNAINGGRLTLRFDAAWTYSGTGTALKVATGGTFNIKDGAIFGNSLATLFDVIAGSTASFSNMTVLAFGEYGTIRETSNVLMSSNGFFGGNGVLNLIDNLSTVISSLGMNSGTPVSGALIRVSGEKTGFFDLSASNITLQPGESFIRFDPSAPSLQATIDKVRVVGGELFDTSGGFIESFTAVDDETITAQSVTTVTDVGGVAQFNYTGPDTFDDQEIVLSGMANYDNGVPFIITDSGTGFFRISSILFNGGDVSGSFDSDSVTLTITSTALVNGSTFVIDTDLSTDLIGGAKGYNQLTNSIQVNKKFDVSGGNPQTGTINTAGIDQTDPRILAFNNPGFTKSRVKAFAFMNGNTNTTPVTDGAYTVIDITGLVAKANDERIKLIDNVEGIHEYIGNEDCACDITATIWIKKTTGATEDYRIASMIDGVLPTFDAEIDGYSPVEVKSVKVQVVHIDTLDYVKGGTHQIAIAGDGTGDDPTITDIKIEIK